jgi:hypothetical protein
MNVHVPVFGPKQTHDLLPLSRRPIPIFFLMQAHRSERRCRRRLAPFRASCWACEGLADGTGGSDSEGAWEAGAADAVGQ